MSNVLPITHRAMPRNLVRANLLPHLIYRFPYRLIVPQDLHARWRGQAKLLKLFKKATQRLEWIIWYGLAPWDSAVSAKNGLPRVPATSEAKAWVETRSGHLSLVTIRSGR